MPIDRSLSTKIKDLFKTSTGSTGKVDTIMTDAVVSWELHKIARELQMSIDDVLLVKHVFDSFDENGNGTLDVDEFEAAVAKLLRAQLRDPNLPTERVKSMCEWYWWDSDKDNSGSIDFWEFLKWYSSNGFNEDLLLSEKDRWLRRIAKRHGVAPDYVESIKRCFDIYDPEGTGHVGLADFTRVLHRVLKVPADQMLPASRIQYFWAEIDQDGSGQAEFEEFLEWWLRYFDDRPTSKLRKPEMPFETFYKQIRRLGPDHLDPPAHTPKAGFTSGSSLPDC